MQNPPPGKCDGDCRKRFFDEANTVLDLLEEKQAERRASTQEQETDKRRPGGQPGNQNARKHDILPRTLSKGEWVWVQKAMSSHSLNMQDDIALMRVRYVQLMFDPNSKPSDFTQVAHAISAMTRTQALINKLYGPPTDNEENDSTPDPRLKPESFSGKNEKDSPQANYPS
jgi:hypothetical protein